MPVMRVMARVLATPTPPPKTATWPCLGSLKALLKIKQSNIFIMLASKVDSCECVLMLSSLFLVVFDKRHFLGVVKTHRRRFVFCCRLTPQVSFPAVCL